MRRFAKFPLYMGFSVLVVAVLYVSTQIGQQNAINKPSKASNTGANLSLLLTPPDLITVSMTSDKEVVGIDVVVRYEKEKVTILPSTLNGITPFIASGGVVDENSETFSFSAYNPNNSGVKSGMISKFNVRPNNPDQDLTSDLQFEVGEGQTAAIEPTGKINILNQSTGVNINIPHQ